MLGVLDLEVNRYLEWVKKGPSEFSEKSEYSHDLEFEYRKERAELQLQSRTTRLGPWPQIPNSKAKSKRRC